MSRWRPEWLGLGLSEDALVAASDSADFLVLAEREAARRRDWDELGLLDAIRPYLASRPATAGVRFLIAPGLARHWTQFPPTGLRSITELRQLTAARCVHLFGGTPEDWAIVADWSLDAPFVCAALPSGLLAAMSAVGRVLKRAVEVESAVLSALSRLAGHTPANGWLVWHTPSTLVLARRLGSRITALRCLRHGAGVDVASRLARLDSALREERTRLGGDAGEEVVLGNDVDSSINLSPTLDGPNDTMWAAKLAALPRVVTA